MWYKISHPAQNEWKTAKNDVFEVKNSKTHKISLKISTFFKVICFTGWFPLNRDLASIYQNSTKTQNRNFLPKFQFLVFSLFLPRIKYPRKGKIFLQILIKHVNWRHFQDYFNTFMRILHQIPTTDGTIVFYNLWYHSHYITHFP